jgi:Cof subfamily protein (haloacid dehalogenase superfamily)
MVSPLHRLRERFDAILIDLDGTLLDRDARVTDRTRQAVDRLRGAGLEVMLCTGRSVLGTMDVYRALELDTALAAFNGGWIGVPGETPWRHVPLPDDVLAALASTEAHAHFAFRHTSRRKVTVRTDHALYARVARWYRDVEVVAGEQDLPRSGVMRVSCYFGDPAHHDEGWARVPEGVHDRVERHVYALSIFREFEDTDLVLCEIQASGRGKAEAFGYLEAVRGIPASRVVAVGDQANDVTMLEAAGLAVSMANGVDEVRRRAHLVIGHHAEEGLAAWVEAGAPHPQRAVRDAPAR